MPPRRASKSDEWLLLDYKPSRCTFLSIPSYGGSGTLLLVAKDGYLHLVQSTAELHHSLQQVAAAARWQASKLPGKWIQLLGMFLYSSTACPLTAATATCLFSPSATGNESILQSSTRYGSSLTQATGWEMPHSPYRRIARRWQSVAVAYICMEFVPMWE